LLAGNVTQAISIFGFAFYIQPIMMPLLLEMPKGKVGVKLISWSTRIVVLVNAFIIYGAVGFFGAAYYGSNTEQNILVNQWLGGGVAQGILNLLMAGMVTKIFSPFFFFPHCKPYMCSLAGFLSKV
jgi:amino acid permease